MSFINRILRRKAPQDGFPDRCPVTLTPVMRRSLDGATGGRRGASLGHFHSVNGEIGAAGHLVGSRAAYLAANNPWIANGAGNLTSYLTGSGARPAPRTDDADLRRELIRRFDEWAEDADYADRTDIYGLQAVLAGNLVVYGEALAILHDTPEGLRIQALPSELLDRSRTGTLSDGSYIFQGVEFDVNGRRIAYWILPERPESSVTVAAPAVRVAAADVIHIVHPTSPGQVRGLSWFAAAIIPASELDALQDALLTSAKVAALHAGLPDIPPSRSVT